MLSQIQQNKFISRIDCPRAFVLCITKRKRTCNTASPVTTFVKTSARQRCQYQQLSVGPRNVCGHTYPMDRIVRINTKYPTTPLFLVYTDVDIKYPATWFYVTNKLLFVVVQMSRHVCLAAFAFLAALCVADAQRRLALPDPRSCANRKYIHTRDLS